MAAPEPPRRSVSGVRFTPGGVAIPVAPGTAQASPPSAPLPQHISAHGQPGEQAGFSKLFLLSPDAPAGSCGAARPHFRVPILPYTPQAQELPGHCDSSVTHSPWCTGGSWQTAEGAGEAADAEAAPWWQALTLSELLGLHARVSCQRPWLVRAARRLMARLCLGGLWPRAIWRCGPC